MNILFINSIGTHKFGGGEKWMITAGRGLRDAGHTVWIGGKKKGRFVAEGEKSAFSTFPISIHADISPFATLRIALFLKKNNIDILICNLNKDVRVAGPAAKLHKQTAVFARHGLLLCKKRWKYKVTLKHLTDGIITNSTSVKSTYDSYGWFDNGFVKVIYNGVELPQRVAPYPFAQRFGTRKVILSAGRLAAQKGFTYLVDAAARLCQERDDLIFVIAGEGKLKADLQRQIEASRLQQRVFLWGYASNILELIAGCDIFVLSSLYEGMPNAVLEAMALAKPVIATAVNGTVELIEDGTNGILLPPKRVDVLIAQIALLLDQPAFAHALGNAAANHVARYFSLSRMIHDLENLFTKTIHAKNTRYAAKSS
ncbi:MAG: glycosyltransferase [Chitinivibrionales bacterium]|nr:glycosyltransferase [Chitinivibrionales bacterium]